MELVAVWWRDAYHDHMGNEGEVEPAQDSLCVGWLLSDFVDEVKVAYLRVQRDLESITPPGDIGDVLYIPKELVQHILPLGRLDAEKRIFTPKRKKKYVR